MLKLEELIVSDALLSYKYAIVHSVVLAVNVFYKKLCVAFVFIAVSFSTLCQQRSIKTVVNKSKQLRLSSSNPSPGERVCSPKCHKLTNQKDEK